MVRILLVDGYGSSLSARDQWKDFCRVVVSACDLQNIHVDMATCKYNKLHEYIYQPDSAFVDPLSIKRFDRLDMVFISGEPTVLPWSPRFQQVLILCRMCFQTNKCMFATTFACHMLAYLCSTGGEPDVCVINGNGKGSPISELPHFIVPHNIKKRDLFFDNTTGDFFQYESVESRAGKVTSGAGSGGEWIPYCHSGLRQRSKFMVNLPRKYKPKEPAGKQAIKLLTPSTIFETVLTVRNRYIQHWAFKGVSSKQFKVGRYNAFDIDEKTSGSSQKSFQVCADSGDGLVPEVIECGNCLGVQFECSSKYADTMKIIENFVSEKYKQMNRHAYLDVSSRFMLMTATTSALDGPIKDHREENPSPLLRKIRLRQKMIEENRVRLEKKQKQRHEKQARERAAALGFEAAAAAAAPTTTTTTTTTTAKQQERKKKRRQRPASAAGSRKHIQDPKLMKPATPVDRGRRSRPATALPYRARVLPKPFIAPGRSGSMSAREADSSVEIVGGRGGGGETVAAAAAAATAGGVPPLAPRERGSVKFAPSVVGGESGGSGREGGGRGGEGDDTLARAANVNLFSTSKGSSRKVRSDGTTSSPGRRTHDGKVDVRWKERKVVVSRVVHEIIEEPKPFSAWNDKFKKLTKGDKAFGQRAVAGVAASGPYISQYKHERLEYMKSKQQWVSDTQFRRFFGKASQVIGKNRGAGIVGSGDYRDPTHEFRDPDDRSKYMNPIRGWRRY